MFNKPFGPLLIVIGLFAAFMIAVFIINPMEESIDKPQSGYFDRHTVEDHDYILYKSYGHTALIHDPDCKCDQ